MVLRAGDDPTKPRGRIRNTRKLLTTAAVIMSILLVGSSVVTTLLIPPEQFQPDGEAYGRALAYLAHERLGNAFGTLYDLSTSRFCGSPGRRRWSVCSTWCRSTCRATGWRRNGPGRAVRWS